MRGDTLAVAEIMGWPEGDVRKATDGLSRLVVRRNPVTADEVAARFKAAAIMLHTDAGLVEIDVGKARSTHLVTASQLMRSSVDAPFGAIDGTLRAFTFRVWRLAVVQSLVGQMAYDTARSLLGFKAAGVPYPALAEGTDTETLLAAGILEEASALAEERVITLRPVPPRGVTSEVESTAFMQRQEQAARRQLSLRESRNRAEGLYRRVLQLDGGCHEARLRLGRVLFDEGQLSDAAGELERVLAETNAARVRYLAALFLGGVREKAGERDAAVGLYLQALAADPRSQTARVALAAALARTGELAAARETVLALADRRATDRNDADPWWSYALGRASGDPLSVLRTSVVTQ
jgi:tetratricopeptide (TPR) repeat protein